MDLAGYVHFGHDYMLGAHVPRGEVLLVPGLVDLVGL